MDSSIGTTSSDARTMHARISSGLHSLQSNDGTTSKPLHHQRQVNPPIYVPRADAMLMHRQMQLHQREHTHATAHGHVPTIPLPHPSIILEDTLADFESTQKQGNILWPFYEFLRKPKPTTQMTQEAEIMAAGYGLGAGRWGRGIEVAVPAHGGARAQQAAHAAAALAAAKSKQHAKEELQPLVLSDHAKDDITHAPPLPPGPKSFYHPPPPLTLLDAALPQTVIYEDGQIQSWYFSSSGEKGMPMNTILKKKTVNCTIENIVKVFLETDASKKLTPWQSTRELDIVATFYPRSFNDVHQVVPLFLTRGQFENFVRNRAPKLRVSGVLQAFIAPKGTHNTLIRCEWTPATCKVLERIAGLPIENPKSKGKGYDIDSRLSTFERNWQVAISEGALLVNENWSEAERKRHEEEYLDMMLNGGIFGETSGLTRKGGVQLEGVTATNTVQSVHAGINPHLAPPPPKDGTQKDPNAPAGSAAAAVVDDTPKLVTTLAYNEHRMTQIECLDQELVQDLNSYCWCVADHLRHILVRHQRGSHNNSEASSHPVLPIKMVLYFKLGTGNKLWFLFMDEFLASQGNAQIMEKFGQQMNDPLRDHLLKLLTPPQDLPEKHAQTASATKQFMENLPIISPTAKRAPFNPRMSVKEWIRYKWSHWEGEYEWNRTLGLLDLQREAKREAEKAELNVAQFYGWKDFNNTSSNSNTHTSSAQQQSSTGATHTPHTSLSVFKKLTRDAAEAEEARLAKLRRVPTFTGVPETELPGTFHPCSQCKIKFELSSTSCLRDHRVAIQDVLTRSIAQKYIRNKTPAIVWYNTLCEFFPGISEEKARKLLRSKHWFTTTLITLCDVCWEDIFQEPRVPLLNNPDGSPIVPMGPPQFNSVASLVQRSVDLLHPKSNKQNKISPALQEALDELLREFLHLNTNDPLLLDESSVTVVQEEREKSILEVQQAAAFSIANARSIAQGMGDVAQRLAAQRFHEAQEAAASNPQATPQADASTSKSSKKSKKKDRKQLEALERQRQARQDKLDALEVAQQERDADPGRKLFPGLDGSPLFHAVPAVHGDPSHIAPIEPSSGGGGNEGFLAKSSAMHVLHHVSARRASARLQMKESEERGEENLAHLHRQQELLKAQQAQQAMNNTTSSRDGILPSWSFLKNSRARQKEAAEREERRLERYWRMEGERLMQEQEEKLRLEATKEQRQKWSERFREEWLEKLRIEAEEKIRREEEAAAAVQEAENKRNKPLIPFPLIPAAGAKPKFPPPEMVAAYVRAHGLPESYIQAYERSWTAVLEPATEKVKEQEQREQQIRERIEAEQKKRVQRSASARTLPKINSLVDRSGSESSRALGMLKGGLVDEALRHSRRVYNSMSAYSPPRNNGVIHHSAPWDGRTNPLLDRQLAALPPHPTFDDALLPPDHALAFDLAGRPETNLNVYSRSFARERSPIRGGGGALREDIAGHFVDSSNHQVRVTSSGRQRTRSGSRSPTRSESSAGGDGGTGENSQRFPGSASILPYLGKSASSPSLLASSGRSTGTATTFGSEVSSPTRVPSSGRGSEAASVDPHVPPSAQFVPTAVPIGARPGAQVYAMAVAEYLGNHHVGYAKAEKLRPKAQYSMDKTLGALGLLEPKGSLLSTFSSTSPLPVVPEKSPLRKAPSILRAPSTTATSRAREKAAAERAKGRTASIGESITEEKDGSVGSSSPTRGVGHGRTPSKGWDNNTTTVVATSPALPDRPPIHALLAHSPKPVPIKSHPHLSSQAKKTTPPQRQPSKRAISPTPLPAPTPASPKPVSKSTPEKRNKSPVRKSKAAAALENVPSSGYAPILDARGLSALQQLHAKHKKHGESCSCEELLSMIHRGDGNSASSSSSNSSRSNKPNMTAAREKLEAWLAEHEDASATLQAIAEETSRGSFHRELAETKLSLQFIIRDKRNDVFPSLLKDAPDDYIDDLLNLTSDTPGSGTLLQRTLDLLRGIQGASTAASIKDRSALLEAVETTLKTTADAN